MFGLYGHSTHKHTHTPPAYIHDAPHMFDRYRKKQMVIIVFVAGVSIS